MLFSPEDDCAVTPVQASLTPQNKTRSTVPDDTDSAATPQNQTAVSVTPALDKGDTSTLKKGVTFPPDKDVSATPEKGVTPYQEEGSTPTVEFPAANSTMVQPGTPAAPFGANITLITNTPAQSTPGIVYHKFTCLNMNFRHNLLCYFFPELHGYCQCSLSVHRGDSIVCGQWAGETHS